MQDPQKLIDRKITVSQWFDIRDGEEQNIPTQVLTDFIERNTVLDVVGFVNIGISGHQALITLDGTYETYLHDTQDQADDEDAEKLAEFFNEITNKIECYE